MAAEPLTYPAGSPSVSGANITLDWLLANPKRVTRVISDLMLTNYYVDKVFAPAGDITGGAVVYDQATGNELFSNRDVERVEPGAEFPIVAFDRGNPYTAQVEKYGGKFPVTDEARRRNQTGRVNRALLQLSNTIVRKVQTRALAELAAAITANSRTASGIGWATAAALTSANRAPTTTPVNDLTNVEKSVATTELGYQYNYAIMNPQEWRNFRLAAGGDSGTARELLADSGINDVWVTNRKTAGTVYWLAQQQVGELGYEVPLTTETWRDPEGAQQDWFQSSILPVVYVTDPFAILETTGHGA